MGEKYVGNKYSKVRGIKSKSANTVRNVNKGFIADIRDGIKYVNITHINNENKLGISSSEPPSSISSNYSGMANNSQLVTRTPMSTALSNISSFWLNISRTNINHTDTRTEHSVNDVSNINSNDSLNLRTHILEPRLAILFPPNCTEYQEDLHRLWRVRMNMFDTSATQKDGVTLVTHGDSARMDTFVTLLSYWSGTFKYCTLLYIPNAHSLFVLLGVPLF